MQEIDFINPEEFKRIYKRIRKDFAAGEYAPYFVLRGQIQNGVQQCFLYAEDGMEKGYAVCAASHPNGTVLISLLAVYPEHRGTGTGTAFLEKIKEAYKDKQGILVEVEVPECARDQAEKTIREKRIRFYEKAGFRVVPHLEYSIWDVPMYLMVYGQDPEQTDDLIQRINEIYLLLMGKHFIHKLQVKKV